MALTPEQLASNGSEHAHQTAFFASLPPLWQEFPELRWIFAIPNGGDRNMAVAANMKAEGVRAGVWDVFLPAARKNMHGLFLEFKKPIRKKEKNGGLSDQQFQFGFHVNQLGYATKVVYTWEQAIDATLAYLRAK